MTDSLDPDELRVGTAEREAAVAALGEHLVAGRLGLDEYEQRAGAAAGARTRGDLRPLFHDLPPPYPPLLSPPAAGAGPGRLPEELRAALTAEGLLVLAEDLAGSMTYRRYRAPGQRLHRRTTWVRGAVAVSRLRLVVWAGGAKRVDLPLAHPLRRAVGVSAESGSRLRVTVDAGAFAADRSGRIDLRFETGDAEAVAALLATTEVSRGRPGRRRRA